MIGKIAGAVDDSSCGCAFVLPPEDAKPRRYVFFEDAAAEAPLMNIGGRDIKLLLAKTTEPDGGIRQRGDRFSRWYTAGEVKVRMDFIATKVCASNDEECESDSYNVTITASQGVHQQTLKAVGGCGC